MILFGFMGGSGVGKSTIQHSLPIKFLTNATTRGLRKDETDGYHINQVTFEDFARLESIGYFAETTEYAGNFYGSPQKSINDILYKNIPYHATLTRDGIEKMIKLLGKDRVVVVYVKPPSLEVLAQRMIDRGDSWDKVQERIANLHATKELENDDLADYTIINNNLDQAILEAHKIVITELVKGLSKNY